MTLNLNHVMITCESHKCFFGDFSVPLAKLRSPNFFKTSTVLPYNMKTNNTNVSVVRGSLHLEAAGTRSSDQTRRNLQLRTDIDSQNNPRNSSILDHSNCVEMAPEKAEIFKSMEDWATHSLLPLLKPATECWQPQDLLPDPTSEGFHDQIREIRARTQEIPDEYFVVLVGDMVTEEALPTYQSRLNGTQVFRDETGVDDTPWAVWARGWSAEENRHGDLLNKYLYLSGRVDMKQVETTIQYLIGSGMDIGTGNNPYLWTIYTSFQERATAISHGNTAKLAMQHGDTKLAQICGTIASDEKRHESAYSKIAAKLFEIDPNGMAVALAAMMKRKISMPAHLLYDGLDHNLFKHFSDVASRLGVYTATDYRHILEHLLAKWNVENLTGLSSDGRQAQDYVCGLPQRIQRLEDRALVKAQQAPPVSFSWIFDRSV